MDNSYFGNICYCRKCNGIVHTIKKGDSLYLLSRYYNVPIGEIMAANRTLNVYNLQIGEEICIPVKRSDMLRENFPAPEMPPSNMNMDMQMENMSIEENSSTSIDKSMKLSDIVQREDITIEEFLQYLKENM